MSIPSHSTLSSSVWQLGRVLSNGGQSTPPAQNSMQVGSLKREGLKLDGWIGNDQPITKAKMTDQVNAEFTFYQNLIQHNEAVKNWFAPAKAFYENTEVYWHKTFIQNEAERDAILLAREVRGLVLPFDSDFASYTTLGNASAEWRKRGGKLFYEPFNLPTALRRISEARCFAPSSLMSLYIYRLEAQLKGIDNPMDWIKTLSNGLAEIGLNTQNLPRKELSSKLSPDQTLPINLRTHATTANTEDGVHIKRVTVIEPYARKMPESVNQGSSSNPYKPVASSWLDTYHPRTGKSTSSTISLPTKEDESYFTILGASPTNLNEAKTLDKIKQLVAQLDHESLNILITQFCLNKTNYSHGETNLLLTARERASEALESHLEFLPKETLIFSQDTHQLTGFNLPTRPLSRSQQLTLVLCMLGYKKLQAQSAPANFQLTEPENDTLFVELKKVKQRIEAKLADPRTPSLSNQEKLSQAALFSKAVRWIHLRFGPELQAHEKQLTALSEKLEKTYPLKGMERSAASFVEEVHQTLNKSRTGVITLDDFKNASFQLQQFSKPNYLACCLEYIERKYIALFLILEDPEAAKEMAKKYPQIKGYIMKNFAQAPQHEQLPGQ